MTLSARHRSAPVRPQDRRIVGLAWLADRTPSAAREQFVSAARSVAGRFAGDIALAATA
jgi:hypothetical protein